MSNKLEDLRTALMLNLLISALWVNCKVLDTTDYITGNQE